MKMKDEENVTAYLLCVDEIADIIGGLGERLKNRRLYKRC